MRIPREVGANTLDPVETTRHLRKVTKAYLLGALHDGVKRKVTYRICQKSSEYIAYLQTEIIRLGGKAWMYKEGKDRNLYVVEFSRSFLRKITIKTDDDWLEYIRGYFDAEGGIARANHVRYYLSFSQKNYTELLGIREKLLSFHISCGVIHNPSKRVDKNYWRFFISSKSFIDFARIIGSSHPIKVSYLRMKI